MASMPPFRCRLLVSYLFICVVSSSFASDGATPFEALRRNRWTGGGGRGGELRSMSIYKVEGGVCVLYFVGNRYWSGLCTVSQHIVGAET